jgi:amino acid transporter
MLLSTGLAKILGISQHQALVLMVPVYFGRALATCFALGKLVSSMASSTLFPSSLARKIWSDDCPIQALSVVSFISLLRTLIIQWNRKSGASVYAGPGNSPTGLNLVVVCGLITYCIQLFGFMVRRLKLAKIPSAFHSPFGILGAVFSFLVFVVGIISALQQRIQDSS